MSSREKRVSSSLVVLGSVGIAALLAWLVGRDGPTLVGVPLMLCCALLSFTIQWLAFVPAYLRQTEHFYDLLGSFGYIAVTSFALLLSRPLDTRAIVLSALIFIWALRLGSFLFRRVRAAGSDDRFAEIKTRADRFFVAWTLQGLWVFVTLCAALVAISSPQAARWGLLDWAGLSVWISGFSIEVASDRQKSKFRREQPDRYIDTGLWAWSRHPNYFGEIVLWTGVAIMASSSFQGWQWLSWISPVFVVFLLTRVSGIPILEQRADARWGNDESYRAYKARTPVLIPRPPGPQH